MWRSLWFFFLLSTLVCFSCALNTNTPFCNRCKCSHRNNDNNIDVDCSKRIIEDDLYKVENWIDFTNTSYAIAKANFSASDIGNLIKPFVASNLSVLDLSRNFIAKIQDSVFSQLQQMSVLILTQNSLETLQPNAFKGLILDGEDYPLRSLKTLRLDLNHFHTLDPDLFSHIETNLEILYLNYNDFKVLDTNTVIAITSIQNLKELYLAFTQLSALPENFMHTPKFLKVLDLSGNNFKTIPPTLEQSHALETLIFNDNPFTNLSEPAVFPNISTLKTLHLCELDELKEIGEGALSKLCHLEELHIKDNVLLEKISDKALSRKDVEALVWPPIKKLYLTGNKLPRLEMSFLLNWEQLVDLDLSDNEWSCDCENKWIVEELMPIFVKLDKEKAEQVKCASPEEMEGKSFYHEYVANQSMRCLDAFGNRPEKDGGILIGILIGLLIGIPLILFGIFAYQRNWFGFFDNGPAAFSRQFYKRTGADEL